MREIMRSSLIENVVPVPNSDVPAKMKLQKSNNFLRFDFDGVCCFKAGICVNESSGTVCLRIYLPVASPLCVTEEKTRKINIRRKHLMFTIFVRLKI
jgi:hypothetical protein